MSTMPVGAPAIHPVPLVVRNNATLRTLYQSFYAVEIVLARVQGESFDMGLKVIRRVPTATNIDNDQCCVESAIKTYLLESAVHRRELDEGCGMFVVTTTESLRYHCFWRGSGNRFFIAVSTLPLVTFSRNILDLLSGERMEDVLPTLLALCQTPIFPACGLQYNVELSRGIAQLNFSAVEQVDDDDVFLIVLRLFNPRMFVSAWEAIILEKKVLVVSSSPSLIAPCVEFLRRIALPMAIVHTFVPLLPESMIDTIEAPFPFLIGADTKLINKAQIDVSDVVVIDLDTRQVTIPRSDSGASPGLLNRLLQDVNNIILGKIGDWIYRPCNSSSTTSSRSDPMLCRTISSQANAIIQVFVKQNLALIGARSCSVRAFYRRPKMFKSIDINGPEVERMSSRVVGLGVGFNTSYGVSYGFLQLLYEDGNSEISDNQHMRRIPCWVELNNLVFALYQYADELPLLHLRFKDIQSISPSPLEPDGHIFELVLRSQSTYRFQATDSEARHNWISLIDENLKARESNISLDLSILEDGSTSNTIGGGSIGGITANNGGG